MFDLTANTEVCRSAARAYSSSLRFFPLIAAVLEKSQTGLVLGNHPSNPTQFYVEHRFGFAEFFGQPDASFERQAVQLILSGHHRLAAKVRLYGTHVPACFPSENQSVSFSQRQRFKLPPGYNTDKLLAQAEDTGLDIGVIPVDRSTLDDIQRHFRIVDRFWDSVEAFMQHASAVVVTHNDQIGSICYSAATSEGKAEIDIATIDAFRGLGLAKYAAAVFIDTALKLGIDPLWDCFTNNVASVSLAASVGFQPYASAYPMLTVQRRGIEAAHSSVHWG